MAPHILIDCSEPEAHVSMKPNGDGFVGVRVFSLSLISCTRHQHRPFFIQAKPPRERLVDGE
jgi:hypothetical protein